MNAFRSTGADASKRASLTARALSGVLPGALLAGVSAVALGACGGANAPRGGQASARSARPAKATPTAGSARRLLPSDLSSASYGDVQGDKDNDLRDRRTERYIDLDDAPIAGFGQPAGAADRAAVTALVQRFLTAARDGDGAAACRLEYSLYREAIPEDYGGKQALSYAKGKTCAEVLTKDFKHNSRQAHRRFRVTDVLVEGNKGYALLGSKTQPASYINLERERGVWKVVGLLAAPLP